MREVSLRLVVLGVLLLSAGICRAQAPTTPPVSYLAQHWSNENGLPLNHYVIDIGLTPDGFVWMATPDGLARFDGLAFRTYIAATTPGLSNSLFVQFVVDHDGALWGVTEHRDLVRYADGVFTSYLGTDKLPAPILGPNVYTVDPVYLAPDSSVWFATESGAVHYDDGQLRPFRPEIVQDGAEGFAGNPSGDFWLVTKQEDIFHFHDGTLVQHYQVVDSTGQPIRFLEGYQDRDGNVWVGTELGPYLLTASGFGPVPFRPLPGNISIRDIYQDPDGAVYFVSLTGVVYVWTGEEVTLQEGKKRLNRWPADAKYGVFDWEVVVDNETATTHILHHDRVVFSLPADTRLNMFRLGATGDVWLGTSHGASRLRANPFTLWARPPASTASPAPSVPLIQTRDGAVWVGVSADELLRLSGDTRVAHSPQALGIAYGRPEVLYEDRSGTLWVGGDELCTVAPTPRCGYEGLAKPEVGTVQALYEDQLGRFWVGGERGYAYYQDDAWVASRAEVGSQPWVQAITETRAGSLWLGTRGQGALRHRSGRIERVGLPEGCSDSVRAFYQDEEGYLWLATEDQGICRITNPDADFAELDVASIGASAGLPQDDVPVIVADDAGRFWMPTPHGLAWVARAALHAVAEGDAETVHPTYYDERDGLPSRDGGAGERHTGIKDTQGRLWFASQQGTVMVDPARLHVPSMGRVHVEPISGATEPSEADGSVELAPGQSTLSVAYVLPNHVRPASIHYQYRLLGHDAQWHDVGTDRQANFADLSGRSFTFQVRAVDTTNGRVSPVTSLALHRKLYSRETVLFALLLLGVFGVGGILAFGVAHYRTRLIHRRNKELQVRVAARTAELEEALKTVADQAKALKSLDKAKSQFFANISHELRTPLTLIIGPLRSMLEGDQELPPEEIETQHRMMLRNSRRLLRLINQILDLAQLESGSLPFRPVRGELADFVGLQVAAFQPLAQHHNLALHFHPPVATRPVYFDPQHLEVIVINLLSNAMKFTPSGGRIDVTITYTAEEARIRVEDSGQGIAPENLGRVFDRFYHHEGSAGTGIGLALVQELVYLHQGRIEVESTVGVGTTFCVYLPMGPVHAAGGEGLPAEVSSVAASFQISSEDTISAAVQAEAAVFDQAERPEDTPVVLVVDDNPDIRRYIHDVLKASYRVIHAVDGAEAIAMVREHLPDLVVSDVMMPRQDGFAFSRALKGDPLTAHIPVILLTARASTTAKLEGLMTGADDYLTKPFDPEELRARIQNQLTMRQRLRARYEQGGGAETTKPEEAAAPEGLEKRASQIVRAQLHEPDFSVPRLADALNMTYATLNRRLRTETGQTPSTFIRRIRLEEAARLLKTNAGSVSEVAYAVGFNSLSYFSRCYTEQFSVRPSEHVAQNV